jgi:hypothetical protein
MPDLGWIFGGSALLTIVILVGTCLTIVISFAFTGAILWATYQYFLRPFLQSAQQRNQILQSGVQATAVVLSLADTGMLVNYQPQVKMVLQVNPPNGAPYQTEVTMVVSQLQIPRVQPGMVVPVKIDPNNPANVAVAI